MSLFTVNAKSRSAVVPRSVVSRVLAAGVFGAVAALPLVAAPQAQAQTTLLNVSYDPTREFYRDYNKAFAAYWRKQSGKTIHIRQSHGGSGK